MAGGVSGQPENPPGYATDISRIKTEDAWMVPNLLDS